MIIVNNLEKLKGRFLDVGKLSLQEHGGSLAQRICVIHKYLPPLKRQDSAFEITEVSHTLQTA